MKLQQDESLSIKRIRIDLFKDHLIFRYLYNFPDRNIDKDSVIGKDKIVVLLRCLILCGPFFFIILIFSNIYYNTLYIDGDSVGLFEEYLFINITFLFSVIPFAAYLFFERMRRFFFDIQGIIDPNKIEMVNIKEKEIGLLQSIWKTFLTISNNVLYIIFNYKSNWIKLKLSSFEKNEELTHTGEDAYIEYIKARENMINGEGKYRTYKIIYYFICWIVIIWWIFFYIMEGGAFQKEGSFYSQKYPVNLIIFSAYWIFVYGVIYSTLIWKMFTCSLILNTFTRDMKKSFNLKMLSADGVAGMSPLGSTVLNFHFVILLPIWNQLLGMFLHGITPGVMMGFIYLPIISVIFFIPFISAHGVMKKHKRDKLRRLGNLHDELIDKWDRMQNSKEIKRKNELQLMERIERVKGYYNDVKSMPVWPMDFTILSRFATSIMIPVLLILIQILITEL